MCPYEIFFCSIPHKTAGTIVSKIFKHLYGSWESLERFVTSCFKWILRRVKLAWHQQWATTTAHPKSKASHNMLT